MDTVQVALRIRPMLGRELERGCRSCIESVPGVPQVKIFKNAFTFNHVFDDTVPQSDVYDRAVKDLVKQLFKGYNVTVLAYGQTGSGKTHSMGTNYPGNSDKGIIPRAVDDIFQKVTKDDEWEYKIRTSFLELYNEQLYDLLSGKPREQCVVEMREDTRGVVIPGLTEVDVTTADATLQCLQKGSYGRATGATAMMDAQSSRSHAVFTIYITLTKRRSELTDRYHNFIGPESGAHTQHVERMWGCAKWMAKVYCQTPLGQLPRRVHVADDRFMQLLRDIFYFWVAAEDKDKPEKTEAMSAKFHLVDLAGSERSKKTKATGDRFKEGVNINKELFILGNVISALGDGSHAYINYRDSKLTRLLQDSLGGNALTIMIACVSPAYDNHSETISTLRYADRARRIKNKPIINQDPKAAEIARLKKENEELRHELLARGATEVVSSCPPEHALITQKVKMLSDALSDALTQNAALCKRALMAEKASDCMKQKLGELNCEYSHVVDSLQTTLNDSQLNNLKNLQTHIVDLQAVQQKIEEEIITHERSIDLKTPEGSPTPDDKGATDGSPGEDSVHQDNYLMQQSELSKQLQELTKNLAWKEQVAKYMTSTSSQMSGMQSTRQKNLLEFEKQIEDLQKEKEELTCQLKNVQTNVASNKLAEQRRKRLQELEQKISALNKKVTEQARLIKVKENSDLKINTLGLHSEILTCRALCYESELSSSSHTNNSSCLTEINTEAKKCKSDDNVKEKPFKCSICHYACNRLCSLKVHMMTHEKETFNCAECDYSCKRLSLLKQHLIIHAEKTPFKCKECDYFCKRRSHLKSHMMTHTGEKPFKCKECDYSTALTQTLKRHMMIHTADQFKCKECGYSCKRRSYLTTHMMKHIGEKPFKCKECDYSAAQPYTLKRHMMIHTGEKPFKCKECDYSTALTQTLKRHMMIHTADQFKCKECGYSCKRRSYLTTHMMKHTGEKPFKCKECDYSTAQPYTLKRHMMIHTEEKPFVCDECGYSCNRSIHLKRHMKTHTGCKS